MKNEVFKLGGVLIMPGERKTISIPLPALYSHSPISLPVQVIHGRRKGPVLFVSAAIHGDEINGVEIIRQLLKKTLIKSLKGTLIVIPIVNVYGFIARSRYLPDRRDLNRSFPGSEKGSMAGRIAHTFMEEVASCCTHGIDLHTGAIGRENLPQIRAKIFDDPLTEEMANAFGAPVILNSELRDGSLREAVAEHNIPVLLYEGGEALRFNEVAIRTGVRGVINVMRSLDMVRNSKKTVNLHQSLIAKTTLWIRATQSGILRSKVKLGSHVAKGDTMGIIADPFGEHEEVLKATRDCIVIGKTNLPLVHEGEALYHVAYFKDNDIAGDSVEAFYSEASEGLDDISDLHHEGS